MALFKICKNCGNEISADKPHCPHCGAAQFSLRELSFGKIFAAILVIAGMISLLFYQPLLGALVILVVFMLVWLTHKDVTEQVIIRDSLREQQVKEQQIKEQNIVNIIEKHIATLALKRRQLLIADEYGVVDYNPWLNEINRFYTTVIIPQVGEYSDFIAFMTGKINDYVDSNPHTSMEFSDAMNPYDYERYCANLLSDIGWNARATKASGAT